MKRRVSVRRRAGRAFWRDEEPVVLIHKIVNDFAFCAQGFHSKAAACNNAP